ncbi:MAG: threonine ammonia-lyase IlvA [Spirochaetaceae bacterium]|jgi:threonine dehydratase|nr:threonine ammonia-lyase IlvA [Spirochaetaceae bacterium]
MKSQSNLKPDLASIIQAKLTLRELFDATPLQENRQLSERYEARIFLKREDLQEVRSYKLRGAYNRMKALTPQERDKGIVCASAGNHAQGVAYSCNKLGIMGQIYMPATTPRQKIKQTEMFGRDSIEIILHGDTFDDAYKAAMTACEKQEKTFIHPFNDPMVIQGQATVGLEIMEQLNDTMDYLFVPVGGGGLISGVGTVIKEMSKKTQLIGVEPTGAASMTEALKAGRPVTIEKIDKFVDGAAVGRVGDNCYEIASKVIDHMITVDEGRICTHILDLYNYSAIVAEPAGALSVAALDKMAKKIKGKTVVCILSGGNNDITRTEEIKERSLLYQGLKHYFMIRFPQRAGALKIFVADVLGPKDDITHFEYHKKNSREKAPVIMGIELQNREDLKGLKERMESQGFVHKYLNDNPDLFQFLV